MFGENLSHNVALSFIFICPISHFKIILLSPEVGQKKPVTSEIEGCWNNSE